MRYCINIVAVLLFVICHMKTAVSADGKIDDWHVPDTVDASVRFDATEKVVSLPSSLHKARVNNSPLPVWSPDGKQILLSKISLTGEGAKATHHALIIDLFHRSSRAVRIPSGISYVEWWDDNTLLLFGDLEESAQGELRIHLVNINSGDYVTRVLPLVDHQEASLDFIDDVTFNPYTKTLILNYHEAQVSGGGGGNVTFILGEKSKEDIIIYGGLVNGIHTKYGTVGEGGFFDAQTRRLQLFPSFSTYPCARYKGCTINRNMQTARFTENNIVIAGAFDGYTERKGGHVTQPDELFYSWGELPAAKNDINARAILRAVDDKLDLKVSVKDDNKFFVSGDDLAQDHVEVWFYLVPNVLRSNREATEALLRRNGNILGLTHYALYNGSNKAVMLDRERYDGLAKVVGDIGFWQEKTSVKYDSAEGGYVVSASFDWDALGFSIEGSCLYFMIDVVDVDEKRKQQTLLSSSMRRKWAHTASFNAGCTDNKSAPPLSIKDKVVFSSQGERFDYAIPVNTREGWRLVGKAMEDEARVIELMTSSASDLQRQPDYEKLVRRKAISAAALHYQADSLKINGLPLSDEVKCEIDSLYGMPVAHGKRLNLIIKVMCHSNPEEGYLFSVDVGRDGSYRVNSPLLTWYSGCYRQCDDTEPSQVEFMDVNMDGYQDIVTRSSGDYIGGVMLSDATGGVFDGVVINVERLSLAKLQGFMLAGKDEWYTVNAYEKPEWSDGLSIEGLLKPLPTSNLENKVWWSNNAVTLNGFGYKSRYFDLEFTDPNLRDCIDEVAWNKGNILQLGEVNNIACNSVVESYDGLELMPNIEEIAISLRSEHEVDLISRISTLKRLHVYMARGRFDLGKFKQLQNLEHLSINGVKGEKLAISFLGELPHLNGLYLSQVDYGDSMKGLELPELTVFSMKGEYTDKLLHKVPRMPKLQELHLRKDDIYIPEKYSSRLHEFSGVKKLVIDKGFLRNIKNMHATITDMTLHGCFYKPFPKDSILIGDELKKLERLNVVVRWCSNQDLDVFRKFTALSELYLQGGRYRDLSFLETMPKLEKLVLGTYDISKDLSVLGRMSALQHLDVERVYGLSDYDSIFSLTKLRTLKMPKPKGEVDLQGMAGMTSLKTLYLNAEGGKYKHVESLGNLKNLERLTLRWIKFEELQFLKGLTKLEYLDLTGSNSVPGIEEVLSGLSGLKYLDISSNSKRDDIGFVLKMGNLEELDLSYNKNIKDLSLLHQLYEEARIARPKVKFNDNSGADTCRQVQEINQRYGFPIEANRCRTKEW